MRDEMIEFREVAWKRLNAGETVGEVCTHLNNTFDDYLFTLQPDGSVVVVPMEQDYLTPVRVF